MGLEKIQVRSPMTCDADLGICALCYGMDLSTGALVEEGMAVGIIAAQSIGEPGTQLTMRTFHIGGTAARHVEESEIKAKKQGLVKLHSRGGRNHQTKARTSSSTATAKSSSWIPRAANWRSTKCPLGANLGVRENQEVMPGALLCQWDPHAIPHLAEVGGKVRFEDIIEGETMRIEKDPGGHERRLIIEHKGDLHPQIVLEDETGKPLWTCYLPEKAHIEVAEGKEVSAGTLLAKTPREVAGTQDITGGLPRVTEIFEARKPKDPAVIAEIDGTVEILGEKRRGKRTIVVRSESGIEREHLVSHGKHFRVHSGSFVKAGDALVDGPLVPHDILRVSGEEEVQKYLTREIQNVYRSQRVEINDKHIEIIVSQMLRKVRVETIGDTTLLPGSIMDKFEFRRENQELAKCLKIVAKGDSDFAEGAIVPIETLEQTNAQIAALGGEPAKGVKPKSAIGQHPIVGHHQGGRAKLQLHLRRQLPGDHQGPHRSGPGRQGRSPGGIEGKRDPRPPHPGGHRLPHLPGFGGPHPSGGPGGTWTGEGRRAGSALPVAGGCRQGRARQRRRRPNRYWTESAGRAFPACGDRQRG